jgi:hypothetical protein
VRPAVVALIAAAALAACNAVSSVDVAYDNDAGGARLDQDMAEGGATEEAGEPLPDAGGPGADVAVAEAGTCACGSDSVCCVPSSGPATCEPDASLCGSALAFGCTGSDNGRPCCLAADGRGAAFRTSCDGGVELCATADECSGKACAPFACRGVTLSACATAATPSCAPP